MKKDKNSKEEKMSKFLVTGGCGFIGSHIVEALLQRGDQVVVIDDESANENHEFYKFSGAEYHKLDICDDKTADLYKGVDVVFHLAARSRIQPTIDDPSGAFESNVLGTSKVLNHAKNSNVKKVIYSSSYGSSRC